MQNILRINTAVLHILKYQMAHFTKLGTMLLPPRRLQRATNHRSLDLYNNSFCVHPVCTYILNRRVVFPALPQSEPSEWSLRPAKVTMISQNKIVPLLGPKIHKRSVFFSVNDIRRIMQPGTPAKHCSSSSHRNASGVQMHHKPRRRAQQPGILQGHILFHKTCYIIYHTLQSHIKCRQLLSNI